MNKLHFSIQALMAAILAVFVVPVDFASAQVDYEAYGPISANRRKAMQIYKRLTGSKVSIDAQIVKNMQSLLDSGDKVGAAQLATAEPQFLNTTVRLMGQRLSTKGTTFKAPLSDMVATIMGIVSDDRHYREILTGDYYYQINLPNSPANEVQDILQSNDHYEFAEDQIVRNPRLDVRAALTRVDQKIANDNDQAVGHPEPSGVLTSRAFMDCANDGTNRRCHEETMSKFACSRLEDIADTSLPQNNIRIDVTRAPGGDPILFQNTCTGCHSGMDAVTGAFAYIKFIDDQVKHSSVNNDNDFDNNGVDDAYNRGADTGFANGYRTTNNSWTNNYIYGVNGQFFGWRDENGASVGEPIRSAGIPAYGRMIASSQAFSRCMVRQTFRAVCGRDATMAEANLVIDAAKELEDPSIGNGKLKWLFERVVTDSACLGS